MCESVFLRDMLLSFLLMKTDGCKLANKHSNTIICIDTNKHTTTYTQTVDISGLECNIMPMDGYMLSNITSLNISSHANVSVYL